MQSTGIVRRVDELGRFTLPSELKRAFNIKDRIPGESDGTSLDIYMRNEDDVVVEVPKYITKGTVRQVDNLGRIVVPIEIRKIIDVIGRDEIEVFTDKEKIILRKHETSCQFCRSKKDLIKFKDKKICKNCLKELKSKMD